MSVTLRKKKNVVVVGLGLDVRWVKNVRPYPSWAGSLGETLCIELCVRTWSSVVAAKVVGGVATEARLHLPVLAHTVRCVADQHAETRLECSGLAFSRGDVVDDKPALGFGSVLVVEEFAVGNLRDALVSAVAGFEVYVCGPVVAQLESD